MSLYRQVPEGWNPQLSYQDFLPKRTPNVQAETETFSQRVDRVASTFVAHEARLMVGEGVIGRLNDPSISHHVVDVPPYLYDRQFGIEESNG